MIVKPRWVQIVTMEGDKPTISEFLKRYFHFWALFLRGSTPEEKSPLFD